MSIESEPRFAKILRGKDKIPSWYLENLDKNVKQEFRSLLENYSGISPEDVFKHVHNIRDKAWAVRAYPCTGLGMWMNPNIKRSPAYPQILEKLKSGGRYVDIGCFVGQDMRQLVVDGAPSNNMYGIDIVNHWDIGYELFRDQGRFSASFMEADVTKRESSELVALEGTVDVIHISHVIHMWPRDGQVHCCKRLVALSRPGTVIVGFHNGNHMAHVKHLGDRGMPELTQFRQSPDAFVEIWRQVSEETETEWEPVIHKRSFEHMGWDPEDVKWVEEGCVTLDFAITRKR